MSKRNLYVLLYIASILVSIGVGLSTKSIGLGVLALFILRFAVNFWYANLNQVSMVPKVLASIFSSCGFFYLLGMDKKLPGALSLLDQMFKIYEKNFKQILIYPLLQFLSIAALAILGVLIWIGASFLPQFTKYAIIGIFSIVIFVAIILVSLIFFAAMYFAIKRAVDGEPQITMKETLILAWGKLASFVGSAILSYLYAAWPLLVAGLIMLIYATTSMLYSLGGLNIGALSQGNIIFGILVVAAIIYGIFHFIYFTIRLSFAILSVLYANQKAKPSLTYSKELTNRRWWAILWRIYAPTWIIAALAMIASMIIQIFTLFGPIGELISGIAGLLLQVLTVPTAVIIMVLLYNELERQKVTPPEQN